MVVFRRDRMPGPEMLRFESISGIAGAIGYRVADLDHEIRNYAVEDRAIVEWNAVLLRMCSRVGPIFRSLRKADEIGDPNESLVGEKFAIEITSSLHNERGSLDGSRGLHHATKMLGTL